MIKEMNSYLNRVQITQIYVDSNISIRQGFMIELCDILGVKMKRHIAY